jgi:tRNA(Ile)-lysidine synthase
MTETVTNNMTPLLSLLKTHIESHRPNRIVVGFSGGLDSSALLHGTASLDLKNSQGKNIPVIAIHVHHGLSGNADDWLEHCAQVCHSLSVECITERVSLVDVKGSLENVARLARYDVFQKYLQHGDVLLLAHHQDDQVETFMMRLMRGSGLTGLSAMLTEREFASGTILRPWLKSTRVELESYVADNNIAYVEDESNADTQFDRNWWRQDLLPSLFKRYPGASHSIVKTIDVLQQERQVLNDLLRPIYNGATHWDQRFTQSNILKCDELLKQPDSVQVQLVRMWLESENAYPLLNSDKIRQIIKDVVHAKEDAAPVYQWGSQLIRRYDGCLYVMRNKAENAELATQEMCFSADMDDVPLTQGRLTINSLAASIGDNHAEGGLKPGDYSISYYAGSLSAKSIKRPSKTLKRWFQAYNVPPWLRTQWPVIMFDGQVVCVPGLFVCEGFCDPQGLKVRYLSSD